MKKGIRYLRFSSAGQSNGSIEWQDLNTKPWFDKNKVELLDSYIDAGYSAKTFDRPDMAKLTAFIAKYHSQVDYLVVNELDRFSRDAGEALTMAKMFQLKYGVQVVSVNEGITFDCHDESSYFRTGLSLLLAENDNIRRMQKINSGIYTAKAKEGRFIGGLAPYGYRKEGKGKAAMLVPNEEEANVIKYIYDAFLQNVALYKIREEASKIGYRFTGNSTVRKLLQHPIYSGQQHVKPWKDFPGGLYPVNHEAIIDLFTWQKVQKKFRGESRPHISISDEMPLRSVIRCHCGRLFTGAPSKGKGGKLYYYYKCHASKYHKDVPAKILHEQVNDIMKWLTLPPHFVAKLHEKSNALIADKLRDNKKQVITKKRDLQKVEGSLVSLEDKFINNLVTVDSYNRWFTSYTQQIEMLKSDIERCSTDYNYFLFELNNSLDKFANLQNIYNCCSTTAKQELVRKVFAGKLYYSDGGCKTGYLMKAFAPNLSVLKEKSLLMVDEKAAIYKSPLSVSTDLSNEELELIEFMANVNVNNAVSLYPAFDNSTQKSALQTI